MSPGDILGILKTTFVDRLDYTLAYTAVTILLFFYGFDLIRVIVRRVRGTKPQKFIIFSIMVLFGINLLLVFLINLILSISDVAIKWVVIIALVLFSFIKFDMEALRR
jgi:hypothetical protein